LLRIPSVSVAVNIVPKSAEDVIKTVTVSPAESVPDVTIGPSLILNLGLPAPLTLTSILVSIPDTVNVLKLIGAPVGEEARFAAEVRVKSSG